MVENGFCPINNYQNGPCLLVCTFVHSNLVIYHSIFSKLHIWITFIKLLPKINCGYCPMNHNQDGCTNGCRLSACMCGHSYLVIYHLVSPKFHMWTTFIKLLFMFEYGFCTMNDYEDCHQNGYPLFSAGH